jgi:hypothetical protein
VAALPYGAPAFIPGTALSLGSRASKFRPPRFIYTVTSAGHLFEYRKTKRGWRLQDLTLLTGGPPISNDLRGMVVAFGKRVVREIFLTDTENHAIRYFFGRNHRWRFEDLSGVAGGASVLDGVTELGMRSR